MIPWGLLTNILKFLKSGQSASGMRRVKQFFFSSFLIFYKFLTGSILYELQDIETRRLTAKRFYICTKYPFILTLIKWINDVILVKEHIYWVWVNAKIFLALLILILKSINFNKLEKSKKKNKNFSPQLHLHFKNSTPKFNETELL